MSETAGTRAFAAASPEPRDACHHRRKVTPNDPSSSVDEIVEATIEDVVFRSDDGRFAVVKAARTRARDEEEHFTAVGDLGQVAPGETLRLRGRFTTHATYGPRFTVESFTPVLPSTAAGIARYLGSGLVPGVGPALAKRLVDRFGPRTLDVIRHQSGRLREVSGIGAARATAIAETVRAREAEAESLSFLHGLGLGPALSRRVLRRYGGDAVRVLREDPYLVAEQVAGIGFRTADRIGRGLGIGVDDPRRAAGAVLHLVARAADEGHVFVEHDAILTEASALDVPEARVVEAIDALVRKGLLVGEDVALYAPPLFEAEQSLAIRLAVLRGPRSAKPKTPARSIEELSADQRRAVDASLAHGLLVLTGGPGTGKTTTVRSIVEAHLACDHRIALCAPTGRAAKRLSEATGHEAKTIHRLLEWSPATGTFRRDAEEPLEAELVLVDEASMLDVRLASKLVAAVAPSAHLVFVGDVDQLPPVGPGQVLREILASEVPSIVRLHEVFRQARASAIIRGAHAVLAGRVPEATPAGTRGTGDLFVVAADDPDTIVERLLGVIRRLREGYGFDTRTDVQVLAPTRRGPLGTERLNQVLQAALNPGDEGARPGAFRPGDKVMQLRNDYDRDVFNGDLGTVRRMEGGITYVLVDGREIAYPADELDALALAYASTVHKVQGSEFPAVVVVLHTSHYVLLSRAMLYTAITRAKRVVVLVGSSQAMARAARNAESALTRSRLEARLRESAAR